MKDPLNGRRYPQVRCTDSGDWYDQQGKLVATHAQMVAFYNHERAAGRVPHFYPRATARKPTPAVKPTSKPKATASTTRLNRPARAKDQHMTQAQRAKRERDRLAATYTAAELKAATQVMQLWEQQAKAGTLPAGFDFSIENAIAVARQAGTVAHTAPGRGLRGNAFFLGRPGAPK